MANKALEAKHPSKDFLNRIPDEVQRLSGAIDDMIWNIRPESDAIESIFERLRDYAAQTLEAHKIDFKIDLPSQTDSLVFPMEVRRNIFMVYKEALNNITKHADCQSVRISGSINNKILLLTIIDDGKGFDLQKPSNRNGLKNMRSRMEEIAGKFEIHTEIGKGSTLKISLPITQKGY
jgi:signal transduction histidine kinase